MDEQINRNILDNLYLSSVENVQHEIYKMNGTEVLKGLENGSLHFITVPREEFIDHTLLPEYITTHGLIIDTMLDNTDGSNNNDQSQQANSSFVTHHSGQLIGNTNEIQLQTNLDESDRRLNAALFQFVKGGNIRMGGTSNTEAQVIVTNKDLVNMSGTHVIDTTVKSDNSNSIDTSTFLTFDDQQSLTNSLINDGQFRIFQQSSPSNHHQQQQQQQQNLINSGNSSSLPQLTPIRRLNRNRKNSISLNITDQINMENLKNNNEIEHIQNFQQRPAAKKVLPHKKRITKKLKSIDVNQRVDLLFQQSDNSTRPTSSQIQFFQDLNEDINADEVINLNTAPQFSCQICGLGAESQLEFFSHLKLHYEPKSRSPEITQMPMVKNTNSSEKEFIAHQSQPNHQVSVSQKQQTSQFQQLPEMKRHNPQVQQQKTHQNGSQSGVINNASQFQHLPQLRRQIRQQNELHCQPDHPAQVEHNSESENGRYLITSKKVVETRDLPDVTNFAFENFPQITAIAEHSHSNTATDKDIIDVTHEYEILDKIENHLRTNETHQVQIPKQSEYLSLPSTNEPQISLPSREILNQTQVAESKILMQPQSQPNHISIQQHRINNLNKIHESKTQHSEQILQNNTIYTPSSMATNDQVEGNLFGNPQYFETKFSALPNQVLNLEQKIDAIRAENEISQSMSDRTNIIKTETMTQSSLICETQHSLNNQIQITTSQSTNVSDGTENITPSIGQLNGETTLHSNPEKQNPNDIVVLQHEEVEFSDPEDMLEGIRGVVDKVQESFDTGDEMEPMSPPRTNWFSNNAFNGETNSKSNNHSTNSRFETSSVENFQIFFKNEKHKEKKKSIEKKFNGISNGVAPGQFNTKNNHNSLISTENSLASSTTNTVQSHSEIDNGISIKMENFSSDFDDSWSPEYEKNDVDNGRSSCDNNSKESSESILDEMIASPTSQVSENETLKNCGVLSGKRERKKYYCEKCLKVFNSSNALKYHELSHSGQRPYPCEVCGKSFYAQNALRAHHRVHSGEKPFTCVDCGRAFRQWGDLNYHRISLHSNEKNFQCEFCGKAFARKYSLVVHRRIHTKEKNYKCDFCPKTFRASSYLQNHRKIHTGEKPYECSTCNKKFRVCGDLRRHEKIHTRTANIKAPQTKEKVNSKKKENKKKSLDDVTTIQLSDTVINMQTQEDGESIPKNYDNETIKNQSDDLNNSTNFMYTSDRNLDQLFKTDTNITSNQNKNLLAPPSLALNVDDTATDNIIKRQKLTIKSSSSAEGAATVITTYIINELPNGKKEVILNSDSNKTPKKNQNQTITTS